MYRYTRAVVAGRKNISSFRWKTSTWGCARHLYGARPHGRLAHTTATPVSHHISASPHFSIYLGNNFSIVLWYMTECVHEFFTQQQYDLFNLSVLEYHQVRLVYAPPHPLHRQPKKEFGAVKTNNSGAAARVTCRLFYIAKHAKV